MGWYSLWGGTACSVKLAGPKSTKPVTYKIRNNALSASLATRGLTPGIYVVRMNCGKAGKATSNPFAIVPPGTPTAATCDVTESGFSAGAAGETPYGIIVTNRSTALTATYVKLAIAFLDGAGNTLATRTDYAMDNCSRGVCPGWR